LVRQVDQFFKHLRESLGKKSVCSLLDAAQVFLAGWKQDPEDWCGPPKLVYIHRSIAFTAFFKKYKGDYRGYREPLAFIFASAPGGPPKAWYKDYGASRDAGWFGESKEVNGAGLQIFKSVPEGQPGMNAPIPLTPVVVKNTLAASESIRSVLNRWASADWLKTFASSGIGECGIEIHDSVDAEKHNVGQTGSWRNGDRSATVRVISAIPVDMWELPPDRSKQIKARADGGQVCARSHLFFCCVVFFGSLTVCRAAFGGPPWQQPCVFCLRRE
jgi:hypothetical protein